MAAALKCRPPSDRPGPRLRAVKDRRDRCRRSRVAQSGGSRNLCEHIHHQVGGTPLMTKHALTRPLTLIAVLGLVVAACSSRRRLAVRSGLGAGIRAAGGIRPGFGAGLRRDRRRSPPALIEAAKAEGNLTTIALPHDWCNYGEVIETSRPSTASPSTSSTRTPARRRDRGDQGQQGQPGPAGAGRHRRRLLVRRGQQGPVRAVQGLDLGHDPRGGQGRRRLLVRRLLRRHGLRRQQGDRRQSAEGLGRPPEARVQGPGRPGRRPALQPGHPGRLRRGARQRRLAR